MSNGTVTVSRPTHAQDGDRIKMEIRHETGRVLVELTPEDFALAITGRAFVPAHVELREPVGKGKADKAS